MKPITLVLLFSFLSCLAFSQTQVIVLGAAHVRSVRFNADSILKVMNKFKPDVILMELDTALMDKQGNLKGRAVKIDQNEEVAMKQYKAANPLVQTRPFDIADRSYYYESHNTFASEEKLGRLVDSLMQHNGLDRESMQIISTLYRVNSALDVMSDMGITMMNSKEYKQMAEFKQNWMYEKQLAVIGRTPELKSYYDFYKDDGEFWDIRNKAMIANIVTYTKIFKGKKIIVLTGVTHTYYLTRGLKKLQETHNFKLIDPPFGN